MVSLGPSSLVVTPVSMRSEQPSHRPLHRCRNTRIPHTRPLAFVGWCKKLLPSPLALCLPGARQDSSYYTTPCLESHQGGQLIQGLCIESQVSDVNQCLSNLKLHFAWGRRPAIDKPASVPSQCLCLQPPVHFWFCYLQVVRWAHLCIHQCVHKSYMNVMLQDATGWNTF